MSLPDTMYVEIGNSTIKTARAGEDGLFVIERHDTVDAFLSMRSERDVRVVCAPVGATFSSLVLSRLPESDIITRTHLASFIGDTYDTPETLGIDRVLNLIGLGGDGLVMSCGTAITVDAVAGGRPYWGAIVPGFRTAAEGLHERVPALPLISLDEPAHIPARTSAGSVANGVLLGTAQAAQALAQALAHVAFAGFAPRIVLTGGDAGVMRHMWLIAPEPQLDDALMFRGMERVVHGGGVARAETGHRS